MADPTVRGIIFSAVRKLSAAQLGVELSGEEADEHLTTVLGAYDQLVNSGAFGRMKDVLAQSDYTAKEYDRVRYADPVVITIPTQITDPCTGDLRSPFDLSTVILVKTGDSPQISVYDALLGLWVRLDGLTLDSDAPFGRRGRDGLACWIAVKIADVYGATAPPATARGAGLFMASLMSKANSPRVETVADYY